MDFNPFQTYDVFVFFDQNVDNLSSRVTLSDFRYEKDEENKPHLKIPDRKPTSYLENTT